MNIKCYVLKCQIQFLRVMEANIFSAAVRLVACTKGFSLIS